MTRDLESNRDEEAGTTLVELLVAVAVAALILAVAANAFRVLAVSADRGVEVIARHDMLSRGIDVLRRDIERLERVARKQGEDSEFVFQADATSLAFVVVEPPYPADAAPYLAAYSIQEQRGRSALIRGRARFDGPKVDIRQLRAEDAVSLLEGPYRLRFAYLERGGERERWVSQWLDRHSLPALISLEIAELAGSRRTMQSIVFRPRVDAERGCVGDGAGTCTIASGGALPADTSAKPEGSN